MLYSAVQYILMNSLDKLIAQFEKFPGVGMRQAKRFAFHVLTLSTEDAAELAKLIAEVKSGVVECQSCRRFFVTEQGELCTICASANRDHARLLVVERDSDVQAMERAGVYDGLYFVFGGTVPLLGSGDGARLRGGALKQLVQARLADGLAEVILGFSINPDGENTARFAESILKSVLENTSVKITHLGRGLSTGSELEYADAETLKSAFSNRA